MIRPLLLGFLLALTSTVRAEIESRELEDGKIVGLPEKYQPATFDLKTGRLRLGPREMTFSPFLMSLFPKGGNGYLEIKEHNLTNPERGTPELSFYILLDGCSHRYEITIHPDTLEVISAELIVDEPGCIRSFQITADKSAITDLPPPPDPADPIVSLEIRNIPTVKIVDLNVEESVALIQKELQGTPAGKLTFRFIDQPEKIAEYRPEIEPLAHPKKNWRDAKVSLEIRSQSGLNALNTVLSEVDAKLEYRDNNEVWIFPDVGTFEKLETKEYYVPPGFFISKHPDDATKELRSNAVRFYKGSSVKLHQAGNRMTVTNTPTQLDLLSQLIE